MPLLAVVLVGVALKINEPSKQQCDAAYWRAEKQSCTGEGQFPLRVHPGQRHGGNWIVMVDDTVVGKRLGGFNESSVAGAGCAVGIKDDLWFGGLTTQPLRKQKGNCSP